MADLAELEQRVKALESDARGEAGLTRRAFEHINEIRDDIAVLRKHAATSGDALDQLKARVDRLDGDLREVKSELRDLKEHVIRFEGQFNAFRREYAGVVAETMREVLKERSGE